MLRKPPKFGKGEFIESMALAVNAGREHANAYVEHMQPCDEKGRYLPYHDFYFRIKKPIDPRLAWQFKKMARATQSFFVMNVGEEMDKATLYLTPTIHRITSLVDKTATTAAMNWMKKDVQEAKYVEFMLDELIAEEAISSSQLEGAATTTIVAKDMIRQKRAPRNPDERMVIGNFEMMKFALANKDKPLTIDLILDMHRCGVSGIEDAKYTPGAFRTGDNVEVVDGDDNVVHTPPPAAGILVRLQRLCDWANEHHDEANGPTFLHPLLKAIVLHFNIGFEHPFNDGNGRVARSLFYWFMFKSGYEAFQYIAISTLLKEAPKAYGISYVHTETDDMDLTYFVEYQCNVIERAIKRFTEAYERGLAEVQDSESFAESLVGEKREKEATIVASMIEKYRKTGVTVKEVAEKLGVSYNTAAKAIKSLENKGIMRLEGEGRLAHYRIISSHYFEYSSSNADPSSRDGTDIGGTDELALKRVWTKHISFDEKGQITDETTQNTKKKSAPK